MPTPDSAPHNQLLAALPAAELERLSPQWELVPMPLGEALYKSGEPLQYVYFPTTSLVSLFYLLENGASAEIALVGNEGALGISQLIIDEIKPCRAVVQSAGEGYRLKVQLLQYELKRVATGAQTVTALCANAWRVNEADRGVQSASSGRTAICWLLLSLDRLSSNLLSVTQDLIMSIFGGALRRGDRSGSKPAARRTHLLSQRLYRGA